MSERGATTSDGPAPSPGSRGARAGAPAPGRSCPAPCRRPGSRRSRSARGSAASPGPRAGTARSVPSKPAAGSAGAMPANDAQLGPRAGHHGRRRLPGQRVEEFVQQHRPATGGTAAPAGDLAEPQREPVPRSHSSGSRPDVPSPERHGLGAVLQGLEYLRKRHAGVAEHDRRRRRRTSRCRTSRGRRRGSASGPSGRRPPRASRRRRAHARWQAVSRGGFVLLLRRLCVARAADAE